MVLEPNVSIQGALPIHVLQQSDRNLPPTFKHAGYQVCLLQLNLGAKLDGSKNGLALFFERWPDQMCTREPQRKQISSHITNVDSIETDQFIERPPVDQAERVEPEDSRHGLAVLHFRKPGMRDAIFLVASPFSNRLATPSHFTRGQAHAQALGLEP